MLVVDASVCVPACGVEGGFEELGDDDLIAPALMWSEARSALHEIAWRREAEIEDIEIARARLEGCPVELRLHVELGERAWQLATDLGWAKTYDAEYLALADLHDCRLVTLDMRLRRGAERTGLVVTPTEL